MAITAKMVKELRERTGAGMMECKKALVKTEGDIDAAIELMRKSGAAKADKKSSRVAAEGKIVIVVSEDNKTALMLEVNCETDFVAKDASFNQFINAVANIALTNKPKNVAELSNLTLDTGKTIEQTRTDLISKIGENIQVRRFELITSTGSIAAYLHSGDKIGAVVVLNAGDIALGKDIAMHIAAINPLCVSEADVPAETLAKEKEILVAQVADSGKPPAIVEKIVSGRLRKYLAEVTLLGQPFVKDSDQTVAQLLKKSGGEIAGFVRYAVGEGIEKKQEDFAAEVMAQVNQSA